MALPLLTDTSKVKKQTPKKLPFGLKVEDWLLGGPNDFAKMGKLKPETKEDLKTRGEGDWYYRHYFTDEDSWASLAKVAGYPSPELLIRLNFGIGIDVIGRPNGEPINFEHVNWFMEIYCNCNRTRDHYNYSFSASAHGNTKKGRGFIWMPKKPATPWPPPRVPEVEIDPEPIEVKASELVGLKGSAHRFPLGGPGEYGHLGEVWDSVRDRRAVLHIGPGIFPQIYFMVISVKEAHLAKTVGKIYRQHYTGFQQDLFHAWHAEVGRRGRPFQRLAYLEMRLLMGVAEGAQGLIGGIIVFGGMAAVEFILDNSHKFGKWRRIAGAVGDLTDAMKKHTPKFYYRVRNALFWEVVAKIPETMRDDSGLCARIAGNWVGGLGRLAFHSTLTALKGLIAVLGPIAAKGAFQIPKAGDAVAREYTDAAKEIATSLRDMGVKFTDDDTEAGYEIIAEVSANYVHLKTPLAKLKALLADDDY